MCKWWLSAWVPQDHKKTQVDQALGGRMERGRRASLEGEHTLLLFIMIIYRNVSLQFIVSKLFKAFFFFSGRTTQHMETLVPWSEIEPEPLALEAGSLNHEGSHTCYFSWSNTCQKHQPANIQSARNAGLLLFPPSILYPVLFHFKSMQNALVLTWIYLINKRPLWNFNQVQTAPKERDHWYSLQKITD